MIFYYFYDTHTDTIDEKEHYEERENTLYLLRISILIRQRRLRHHDDILGVLTHLDCPEREAVFSEFETKWQNNTVVMDKWFSLQAVSHLPTY